MARRMRLVLLTVVVAMVATGCLRLNVDLEVTEDGSGTLDVISAVNPDRLGAFSDLAGDGEAGAGGDLCEQLTTETGFDELPDDAVVEPYNEDGFCGERVRYDFPAGTDVGATLADAFGELNDGPLTIEKQGDEWVFDAQVDAQLDGVDELGDEEIPAGLAALLFGDMEFEWRVTMPGRPIDGEHNADRVEGTTFIWDLDLFDPEPRLFARTEPGGVGSGLWRWIVLAVTIAAVALLGVLLLRRRRAASSARASAESSWPGGAETRGDAGVAGAGVVTVDRAGDGVGAAAAAEGRKHSLGLAGPPVAIDGPVIDVAPPPDRSRDDAGWHGSDRSRTPTEEHPTESDAAVGDVPGGDEVGHGSEGSVGADDAPARQAEWDDSLGAWVFDDPVRGRLVHDDHMGRWNPG